MSGNRIGPLDASDWEQVSGQLGTNLGGMFAAPDGTRYYVKLSKSADHARSEVLASQLYREAGIDAADIELAITPWDLALGTASPEIPDALPDLESRLTDPGYLDRICEGYVVDAWLCNWDVAGLSFGNIITNHLGMPVRVDLGGALIYRALGATKGAGFGPGVPELDSLVDAGINPAAAAVFSRITDTQKMASARRVVGVSPVTIDRLVHGIGFESVDAGALARKLKDRRACIAARFCLELPEYRTGAA